MEKWYQFYKESIPQKIEEFWENFKTEDEEINEEIKSDFKHVSQRVKEFIQTHEEKPSKRVLDVFLDELKKEENKAKEEFGESDTLASAYHVGHQLFSVLVYATPNSDL